MTFICPEKKINGPGHFEYTTFVENSKSYLFSYIFRDYLLGFLLSFFFLLYLTISLEYGDIKGKETEKILTIIAPTSQHFTSCLFWSCPDNSHISPTIPNCFRWVLLLNQVPKSAQSAHDFPWTNFRTSFLSWSAWPPSRIWMNVFHLDISLKCFDGKSVDDDVDGIRIDCQPDEI